MPSNIVEGEPGIFPDPIARLFQWVGRLARRLSRDKGLVDVQPVRWDRYEETRPGELSITFFSSPHPGYGDVDRTEVVEEDDRVIVTLYLGNDAGLSGPLTLQASEQTVTVQLSRPLAGRTVVDGGA